MINEVKVSELTKHPVNLELQVQNMLTIIE